MKRDSGFQQRFFPPEEKEPSRVHRLVPLTQSLLRQEHSDPKQPAQPKQLSVELT